MGNFWHFGDSFSNAGDGKLSFGLYLSNKLNLKYQYFGISGSSNPMIFSKIIENDSLYKSGDVIFINWSFYHRGWYIDTDGDLKSTNEFFDDDINKFVDDSNQIEFMKSNSFIMDYTLNYSYDSNVKLFKGFVRPYFNSLNNRKVITYNLFIRDGEPLYHDKKVILDYNINLKNKINFNPNYFDWLSMNGYKNEEDGHYSKNIQEILSDEILKRIPINEYNFSE